MPFVGQFMCVSVRKSLAKCPECRHVFVIAIKSAPAPPRRSARDPQRRSQAEFMESLKLLGRLYDYEASDEYFLLELQEFLEQHVLQNSSDLTSILEKLSPQCNDLALRCYWQYGEETCFEGENGMLLFRRTQYGFCCTFNYVGRDNYIKNP